MKRKLISLFLALVMVLELLPVQALAANPAKPVDTTNPYVDVRQKSWYYNAVQYVRINGLFSGTSKTTFGPKETMTRGMFVTVLGRLAGVNKNNYTGSSQFSDVAEDAYYAPYVAWAVKYGITVGTGGGKFSPNEPINRQQMAVFFVNYFDKFGVDYETGTSTTSTPADFDKVSKWAKDAVLRLWRTGLLVGDGKDFLPLDKALRSEVAAICYRTDETVTAWYSEPGVASTRVRLDPETGLPYDTDNNDEDDDDDEPSGGGGGGGSTPSSGDSKSVKFYDGSRLIKTFTVKKGEPLGQLPTVAESSKANCILEGYYTDSGFTEPFYAENPVTSNMNVYAKYESMDDPETLTPDSFARMDQPSNASFRFQALEGTTGSAEDAVTLTVKDGSDPVEITVTESGGIYTVSAPNGFNPGCSYELKLAEGWSFLPDGSDTIPGDGIRTAAFSIEMAEVESLSMNSDIRYVKDTEQINYTYTDQDSQSHSVEELVSDADITGGGSFNYSNTAGWNQGDILCIYVGGKPDDPNETERTQEAIYAKFDSIDNGTVHFVPLTSADQSRLYNIPDNFPIQVAVLPTGATGTVSISDLDATLYAQMVGAAEGTLDQAKEKLSTGDFVSLYVDPANITSESDVYFGRITSISGDTITYEPCTAAEIEESANLYKSVDVENTDMVTPAEQAEIEHIVQAQVEQSDFAEDAAWFLADMATQTESFRKSAGVRSFTATGADGEPVSDAQLSSYADLMALDDDGGDDDGVDVRVSVVTDKDKLHFGSKGIQLAVQVDAGFKVDTEDDGEVHFDLSATFVQEAAIDPKVRGELVTKKILKVIPVPTGVQVNAIVDVKSYTAMSVNADIYTVAAEEQSVWESFKAFTKDPSALTDIPGLPAGLTDGLETVGEAIDKIEDTKAKIDKGLEDAKKLQSDLDALWSVVEASQDGLTREWYDEACETLGKTNAAGELMDLLHLSEDEISAEYFNGLDELMDKYSEMLEKETDWVQLVNAEMVDSHTPPEYGIMVGVKANFVVRADVNITLGTNLEYEVGKRYNFWFRVGLFKPTSGSSTMDLIDEHFAFQFYVMGKLGLKTGVRVKLYAAIGSADAISVGLTTELGPYVKLWGFFIYDYSKYRPANTQNWTRKEQMAGAMYLEFGLYLMVGVEAKALFLEFDKDFVDEEFPLLDAGDRYYYYNTAYEPLDDEDEIVVYNDDTAALQSGCAISMLLPEDTYALKYIDLTTGRQGTKSLDFDSYTFKVSNPNFRVDNVGGKPVISVISIPENVRLMQCDLTVTYKHGKLAFSTFDMSATVHLAWTNMTAAEYQQVYTATVTVPDGEGGREAIWTKRVRKGTPFDLPTEEEIKSLLSWSDSKYTTGSGYGSQPTEGVTLIEDTQYNYDLGYQSYQVTVTGIEGGSGNQTFTGKYGEPFDFSDLMGTGKNGPDEYTSFAGLMMDGTSLALNQPIDGRFATAKNATATAQYADETVTATFQFAGIDHGEMEMKLRKGSIPDTTAVEKEVPSYMAITGFYPTVGPMEGDLVYQVVCNASNGTAGITLHANGGSEIAAVSKPIGSVLGTLPTPTRTGYTFGGWFTDDGTFADPVDANTVVEGEMDLYAKWTAKSVTVTFNVNGGVNLDADKATKTVTYDQAYGELPTPERSGHGFRGWFTEETGGTEVTADTTVSADGNHILYAHWVELKVIPRTAFDFGAQETFTYDKSSRTASYTFNPDSVDCPDEDSFTIDYIRVADTLIKENVSKGAETATAGTYNVHITREADETYAKFDQNYTNVLVINRATRTLPTLTDDDILLGEQGLTYQKVSLSDAYLAQLDQPDGLPYFAYRVRRTNYVPESWNGANTVYVYDNPAVESGLLYDLTMSISILQTTYTIQNVLIIGDVNYEDVESNTVSKQFTIYEKPISGLTTWKDALTSAGTAATAWYEDNKDQDEFVISTAEELAYFADLVWRISNNVDFAGKTVRLDADIELYGREWIGIGVAIPKTETNPSASHPFRGTFDGNGHTIRGMYGERGLFRAVDGAVIKNLTLEDSYVYAGNHYILVGANFCGGNEYPGGIVGYVLSNGVTFENCVSTATPREKGAEQPKADRSEVKDRFYNTHESASGATVTGVPEVLRPYPRVESGGIGS